MKKLIIIVLVLSIFLMVSSCGKPSNPANEATPEPKTQIKDTNYYWKTDIMSQYPLGENAEIRGVAAVNNSLYICGVEDEQVLFIRIPYEVIGTDIKLQDPVMLELTSVISDTEIINMFGDSTGIYVLAQKKPSDTGEYSIIKLKPDGTYSATVYVEFAESANANTITVDRSGYFYLQGINSIYKYSSSGDLVGSIDSENYDIYSPVLTESGLCVQCLSTENNEAVLCIANFEDNKFETVDFPYPLEISDTICFSYDSILISDGIKLFQLDSENKAEPIFDWYEISGDYGYKYKFILQLSENTFILVPKEYDGFDYLSYTTGELIKLHTEYCEDHRECVRIGIYGQGSMMFNELNYSLNNCSPDFKVECVDYGSDESGFAKLSADLTTGNTIDIVISEGWQFDKRAGFTDLYQYIDNDREMIRSTFIPEMLDYLEYDGKLTQIWGSFGLSSIVKFNELAASPEPLTLLQCKDYLESMDYEGVLFDNFITKDVLLNYVSNAIIRSSFDAEAGEFDLHTDYIKGLIEICNNQASEFMPAPDDPNAFMESSVLKNIEVQMDNLDYMQENNQPHDYFDGVDNVDNFTSAYCNYSACYMIPESSENKDIAWEFIKTLLSYDYQVDSFGKSHLGYPTNSKALETALRMSKSEITANEIELLIHQAIFTGYDENELKEILAIGIQPYFQGQHSLEEALEKTEGRLNIWYAEHH